MNLYTDFEGRSIRLSPERLEHILEHPEMVDMAARIAETLAEPMRVIESLSDSEARLYYRYYIGTRVGDKHLCVIVKVVGSDAFVVTAYLTDRVKKGRVLWPRGK